MTRSCAAVTVQSLTALSLTTFSLWGCLGTPTPLAPGLGGSVGWPHHGVQTGAVELPEAGPGFVRYRKVGGFNWGQPALVRAVKAAALEVQTALPGVTFGATFPKLAALANRIAVVRSFASNNGDHQNYVSVAGGNSLKAPMGTLYVFFE